MKEIERRIGRGGRTRPLHQRYTVITRYVHTKALVTVKDEFGVSLMGRKQDRQACNR